MMIAIAHLERGIVLAFADIFLIFTASNGICLRILSLHHTSDWDGAALEVKVTLDLPYWGVRVVVFSQIVSCLGLIILVDGLDDVSLARLHGCHLLLGLSLRLRN